MPDQLFRFARGERLEQHVRGVELATGPRGAAVEQVGAGHAHQQDGRVARQVGNVLDQVEECLLAPLEIVEHDDQLSLAGGRLEQLAEGPRELVRCGRRGPLVEQREQCFADRLVELHGRKLPDDLDHRPVRDPFAVGQAAPHDGRVRPAMNSAARRDLPTPAVPRMVNNWHEWSRIACSYASRSRRSSVWRPTMGDSFPRTGSSPAPPCTAMRRWAATSLLLALHAERVDRLSLDTTVHQAEGLLADQDVARRRGLLEARRHVDRVAGGQPLGRAGDNLPGVDADARLERELGERVAHLGRRPDRPQRVVLVDVWHAEDCHHRVADELLDAAAMCLDDRLHALEVARQQGAQRLGIG